MTTALVDLNGQVRLSRTQKGYTWEIVVPVIGIGAGAFADALDIALDADARLAGEYGPMVPEPAPTKAGAK